MKAHLICHGGLFVAPYSRDPEALIAQGGKTITVHGYKRRVGTEVWGVWSEELVTEARSINEAAKALQARKKALDARLLATQPAALAAAKAAPVDPKPEPFRLDGKLKF